MMAARPTVWFDLGALAVSLARAGERPHGIPRVVLNIVHEALNDPDLGPSVGLCRYDEGAGEFLQLPRDFLDAVLANSRSEAADPGTLARLEQSGLGRLLGQFRIRRRMARAKGIAAKAIKSVRQRIAGGVDGADHPFADGDTLVILGLWCQGAMPQALARWRADGLKLQTIVLIHDCLPLDRPELFLPDQQRQWRKAKPLLPAMCDIVLANSDHTMAAVHSNWPQLPVRRIVLGDDFTARPQCDAGLPLERRDFVLMVGTIEVRKNHQLALDAWRLLIARRPDVPRLVFAGRWGWGVETLREELRDTGGLGGKIEIVQSPSDEELMELYRTCRFTIFPSKAEGWGLPVRESLANGRVCLAARNSAIAEAGGALAHYFKDGDLGDFVAHLDRLLDRPELIEASEAEIERQFREVSWKDSWSGIKAILIACQKAPASLS